MKYVLLVYLPALIVGLLCLLNLSGVLQWSELFLAWTLISGLGIAVGFHRIFSHRAFTPTRWMNHVLLFLGTLGGQGSSVTWAAVHRGYHHRHSDTEKDLHSPKHGIWHAMIGWYWKLKPTSINHKHAVDLLRMKSHVWVHKHYIPLLWLWASSLLMVAPSLFQVYMAALALSLLQDNLVNLLCHSPACGYRNHLTKDNSRNVLALGYLGWGQGWHNNHHANPGKFLFKDRWWEFDPCILFLPLLKVGSTHASKTDTPVLDRRP
jgi:fatty-acid desaturase